MGAPTRADGLGSPTPPRQLPRTKSSPTLRPASTGAVARGASKGGLAAPSSSAASSSGNTRNVDVKDTRSSTLRQRSSSRERQRAPSKGRGTDGASNARKSE